MKSVIWKRFNLSLLTFNFFLSFLSLTLVYSPLPLSTHLYRKKGLATLVVLLFCLSVPSLTPRNPKDQNPSFLVTKCFYFIFAFLCYFHKVTSIFKMLCLAASRTSLFVVLLPVDCWDGPNDDPIVYHGHTLTSKVPLLKVAEAIMETAFENSDYPVILSIENHLSVRQQQRMATILRNVFKDALVTDDDQKLDNEYLPSPDELRRKIIVKVRWT